MKEMWDPTEKNRPSYIIRGLVDCHTITLVSIKASYLFFYFFCRAFKDSRDSVLYLWVCPIDQLTYLASYGYLLHGILKGR